MDEELRKKYLEHLKNPFTDPYEHASNFFIHPWGDGCSDEEIIQALEEDARERPRSLFTAIKAIEMVLAEPDKYDLVYLVAWGANQALDDPQNESIPWLRAAIDQMKEVLGKHGHDIA